MEPKRHAIVVDDKLTPEELIDRAASYFDTDASTVVEIDLSMTPDEDRCRLILDYLEAAFAFKRREIALKIATNSSKELVLMIRHSDVITQVFVKGPFSDKAADLVLLLRAQLFPSIRIYHEAA